MGNHGGPTFPNPVPAPPSQPSSHTTIAAQSIHHSLNPVTTPISQPSLYTTLSVPPLHHSPSSVPAPLSQSSPDTTPLASPYTTLPAMLKFIRNPRKQSVQGKTLEDVLAVARSIPDNSSPPAETQKTYPLMGGGGYNKLNTNAT